VLGVFKENLKEDVVVFTLATSSGDSVDTLLPESSHTLLASRSATISRVLGVLSDEALLTTCGALHTEVVHASLPGSSCATSLGLNSMDLVLDSSLTLVIEASKMFPSWLATADTVEHCLVVGNESRPAHFVGGLNNGPDSLVVFVRDGDVVLSESINDSSESGASPAPVLDLSLLSRCDDSFFGKLPRSVGSPKGSGARVPHDLVSDDANDFVNQSRVSRNFEKLVGLEHLDGVLVKTVVVLLLGLVSHEVLDHVQSLVSVMSINIDDVVDSLHEVVSVHRLDVLFVETT
jgi:hypothetical protein